MNTLVVDMEHDMHACESLAPAQDGVHDRQHLLDLDVVGAVTAWASDGEPTRLEMAPEPFVAAGVSVNMNGGALGRNETDAVPIRREHVPPCDVTSRAFRDAPERERCTEN
jgi:hypothetical protein